MTRTDDEKQATGVSVGDGSLGGPAIGGSVIGPDAGVIKEPFGDDVAAPLETEPPAGGLRVDPSLEPAAGADEASDREAPPAEGARTGDPDEMPLA